MAAAHDTTVRRAVIPEILFAPDVGIALEITPGQAAEALERGRFGKATLIEGRLAVGREQFLGAVLGLEPDAPEPIALDARGAADYLNVSRAHWLRLVASGRAPLGVKLGARRVWSKVDLASWLAADCPSLARWQAMRERVRP